MLRSSQTRDFFEGFSPDRAKEELTSGAWLLRGFALDNATALQAEIERVGVAAPFRHLVTPGGFRMSVAMTNCGRVGWGSGLPGDLSESRDPLRGPPGRALPG